LGFSWDQIGSIFFVMLLPFLFFEYPIGWLADKKWGEREMAFFFLTWLGFFTAILYFFEVKNFWLWTIGLLLTRVGAASVQILRDSYFYKRIAEGDFDLIDVFRTALPVGYIMAALVSGLLLQWVDLKTLFLVNAIVVFSALFPTYLLHDNLSEEEKKRRV
jgi:MFS family permease